MVRDGAVDGRVYTSREVFDAEIERIFARSWNYVGHLSEIPQPGDYRRVTVADRPLILIRHEDGTPRVLLNRCSHRGAAVVGRDCGRARRLRCPYHGWTYATDGELKQFPLPGGYAGEDAPRRGDPSWSLESYPVETYRNFAFVRLEEPEKPLPLAEFLGPAGEALDLMTDRSPTGRLSVAGGRLAIALRCNWKVYLENLHDGLHPPHVHESSISAARAGVAVPAQHPLRQHDSLALFAGQTGRCRSLSPGPAGTSGLAGTRQPASPGRKARSRSGHCVKRGIRSVPVPRLAGIHGGIPVIVLPERVEVPSSRLRAAERVLYLECEYLNLGRYDEWLALFSESCLYWAPLAPGQNDAQSHSSLFHEHRRLMRMRIDRITHKAAHSLAGGIRTSRTVGPAALREIDKESGDWLVDRRFQMIERQGERIRSFAGLFTYRLTRAGMSFRIREKRVDLIDCDAPHEPLEVFF